jgi:hypothetical protein
MEQVVVMHMIQLIMQVVILDKNITRHIISESEYTIYMPVHLFLLTKIISVLDKNDFSKLFMLMHIDCST